MIKILDCTFRDGGYYTNWDFDPQLIKIYTQSVSALPISCLEVGYRNHSATEPGYTGRFNYLSRADLEEIRAQLAPQQQLAVMLNAKDCYPERIPELLGDLVGVVDLVRMAVNPNALVHGVALAKAIHEIGLAPAINIMYLSNWANDVHSISQIQSGAAFLAAVSLVDSYGSCMPTQVANAVKGMKALMPNTPIGFHGHDNMGLAFANTLAAIDAGADIVDGTFVGMGRGAGNLKTEMMLVHQATTGNIALNYDALSNVVSAFEKLQSKYKWGTNLAYMISGATNLPQGSVMDWLGKNRYTVASILNALQSQSGGNVDDKVYPGLASASLPAGDGAAALIIGGGKSVKQHISAIAAFVQSFKPVVIHATLRHISHVPRLGERQILCLAGEGSIPVSEYGAPAHVKLLVVPQPPRFMGSVPDNAPAPVYQVSPYASENHGKKLGPISDIGPVALALGAAKALAVKQVFLVGFDGYDDATAAQQELAREVQASFDSFMDEHAEIKVESLTPTLYDITQGSVYSRLVGSASR